MTHDADELIVATRAPANQFGGLEYTVLDPKPPNHLKGGQLVAKQGEKTIPIPLKHTDVSAQIALSIASVRVKQQYHNPYDGKIEAVYLFPLPSDAAVRDFIMVIGDRKIRGIIREKAEAEKIYNEAKRQGKVASLLTQHRPNIFEQAVANIEPGKSIDIDITYFHALPFAGDSYEFHFPMVVGPRFNPPGSTGGIGAAPRGGAGDQKTNVEYLAPDEITSHDISLKVDLDAGLPIGTLESPSHKIVVEEKSETRGVIKLAEGDRIPNKDFVLRYSVAGKKTQAAMVAHRDEKGGTFLLSLQPPKELADIPAAPREMVFVLDCSGSMTGTPLAIAKRSLERCLRRMKPTDTFQIIRFSDNASAFGPRPVPASEENVARAIKHVAALDSEGGTMMIEGIKAALDFPHDPERFRIVSFMTDGYIGNEREILGEIRARLGAARIFSFGIGSSVNRYLIESMAAVGRGVVAYVGLNEDGERAVDRLYQEIEHPALVDVKIDFGALKASNVYPPTIPDLFLGRPVLITGRFEGKGPATIKVSGTMGGKRHEIALTVEPKETHPALPALWARAKIAELDYQMAWTTNTSDLVGEIRQTALEFGLMSEFTSFVAVDSASQTEGKEGTTVTVPVPVPKGVKYETTVPEGKKNE